MTTGPQDLVYRPIHDPLYDMTRVPIPVDGDTNIRISQSYPSNSKGTGNLTDPLNAGHITTFNITQGAAMKFRWGTMALRLNMVFHEKGATGASCPVKTGQPVQPLNAPPWNMVGALIQNISLTINSGADLYTCTSDHFVEEFTARMLTQYDYDTLNAMDMTLFTPIGAKSYSIKGHQITTATSEGPTDSDVLERARKYCQTATNVVTHTKIISFNDLFPRLPDAIFKNMRQIIIRIQWVNDKDLLDHFGEDTPTQNTHGAVSLVGCDVITDAYVPASTQALDTISEKTEGAVDYLGYLTTQVYQQNYTVDNAIIIPSIKNFDSVLIYRAARGIENTREGVNKRTYNSIGEFSPISDGVSSVDGRIKLRADHPAGEPVGSKAGFESVQISIGGQDYPSSPIICDHVIPNGTVHCFDPATLYYYYCLGVNRFGRRDFKPAITYEVFRATMPFIYLRPFSSNGVKPTPEGRDLIIKLRGGTAGNIIIVVFRTAVQTLSRDGVVKAYQ